MFGDWGIVQRLDVAENTIIFDSRKPGFPIYAALVACRWRLTSPSDENRALSASHGVFSRQAGSRAVTHMDETPSFDLHVAESAAQAAATWLVLEAMLRLQLKDMPYTERVEFFDGLLETAESITLPVGDDSGQKVALEWIARRYWELIENFAARPRDV